MRKAHDVAAVRAAEHALMATVPPGALMQRAATGLAAVCAGLTGKVYGARIVVLAGSGDNGGDALYAGARLARRGARVTAVAAGGRVHEGGTAALRAADRHVVVLDHVGGAHQDEKAQCSGPVDDVGGAEDAQGEFKLLQDFVQNPSNVDGTASALEAAAAKAFGG